MSALRIAFLFVLVNLPIALGIYMGTAAIPDYIETRQEEVRLDNYFLTPDSQTGQTPAESSAALKCEGIMDSSLTDFSQGLAGLGHSAYAEYKELKAVNPEASPYDLAGRYMHKLRLLEKECDTFFNSQIMSIEQDLPADSPEMELLEQARYAYAEKKMSIKREFYQKGLKLVSQNKEDAGAYPLTQTPSSPR
jgi:hypothetical protein